MQLSLHTVIKEKKKVRFTDATASELQLLQDVAFYTWNIPAAGRSTPPHLDSPGH